jgi:pimeloyl-ACP methyl ester carboxylesterase
MADITAGGVRFHVQRLTARHPTRTRPVHPVVFIHGLGMDNLSSFYFTLANPLANTGADVILYDLRGHGLSERPRTGYQVNDSVTDLAALLNALDIKGPVHLIGNSYGGTVALGFAIAHPEQVASIVLIEAHFSVTGWAEQILTEQNNIESTNELHEWLHQLGRKVTRLADMADDLLNHTTFLTDLKTVRPIPMNQLSALRCPMLAVYGEHSDVVDYARQLHDHLPHCALTVLPGCGHSVLMDATVAVRDIVLDWFATQASVTTR